MSSYSEGQTHQLMDALEVNKWLTTDITKLGQATPEQHQAIREFLNEKANIISKPIVTYPIKIDYSNTFEQHIAIGHYDYRDPYISEKNFPIKGTGKIKRNLEMLYFYHLINSEIVLETINALGYRPATIEELLTFGATYPKLQHKFPIVALGSVGTGTEASSVVYLCKGKRRCLNQAYFSSNWSHEYRFLVVRK